MLSAMMHTMFSITARRNSLSRPNHLTNRFLSTWIFFTIRHRVLTVSDAAANRVVLNFRSLRLMNSDNIDSVFYRQTDYTHLILSLVSAREPVIDHTRLVVAELITTELGRRIAYFSTL